jgi:CBS domain-containing protein/sporulation protein YlmC with PRC-barrel domain
MASLRTTDDFLFLSEVIGRPLMESTGARAGKVGDLIVSLEGLYPRVTALVIRQRRREISRISWERVTLKHSPAQLEMRETGGFEPFRLETYELPIREKLLDQQIVDTEGCKVVRVNDIHFVKAEGSLYLVHVDVGTRGLIRRLGWERGVDGVMVWLLGETLPDHFVAWKDVHLLTTGPLTGIQLRFPVKKLSEIHPADLAEILEDLSIHQQSTILQSLETETAAQALGDIEPKHQVSLIEHLEPTMAADLLEEMPPNEAADLLGALRDEVAEELLDQMEDEKAEEMRELLTYEEDTAGGAMTTDYVAILKRTTVGEAVEQIRAMETVPETATILYVVDGEEHLMGIVPLWRLLSPPLTTPIDEVMIKPVISVDVDTGLEEVREAFGKYDLAEIPVVDEEGRIKGVITLREAVKEIVAEFQ